MAKKEIDWQAVEEYVRERFESVESDLDESFRYLRTVRPVLNKENYPPRLEIKFVPKNSQRGKLHSWKGYMWYDIWFRRCQSQLFSDHEKELKEKQEKISELIARIAEERGLIAASGIGYGKDWERGLGLYTLKPNYQEFAK